MNRHLVILTHAFPFNPPVEQFLLEELNYFVGEFDKINIIATSRSASHHEPMRLSDNQIEIKRLKRKPKVVEAISGIVINILSDRSFIRDLITILTTRRYRNMANIREVVSQYTNANACFKQIKKILYYYQIKKDDSIVIYSYWLNSLALTGVFLKKFLQKKGSKNVLLISRAHGLSDLYLNETLKGFRPALQEIRDSIDTIYAISITGYKYLVDNGLNAKSVAISRLGVKNPLCEAVSVTSSEIVSCSTLYSLKRVDRIIDALAEIKNTKIKWTHFGGGSLFNELNEKCKNMLGDNIEWAMCGSTSNEKIIDYYCKNRPRCFINVSEVEGIPVSIMEAFSCGIPAIATDVGGTKELVVDKENGYLIPKEFSSKTLSNLIVKMVKMQKADHNRLSVSAYEKWHSEYNSKENYQKFVSSIKSSLKGLSS